MYMAVYTAIAMHSHCISAIVYNCTGCSSTRQQSTVNNRHTQLLNWHTQLLNCLIGPIVTVTANSLEPLLGTLLLAIMTVNLQPPEQAGPGHVWWDRQYVPNHPTSVISINL